MRHSVAEQTTTEPRRLFGS